jgi:hypothetical protein
MKEIELYQFAGGNKRFPHTKKYKLITKTLVDEEDYDRFSNYIWLAEWQESLGSYYAKRHEMMSGKSITIYLHREILNLPRNPGRGCPLKADHINHDTLDNRRSNLRICDNTQSVANRRRMSNGKGRFRGVYPNQQYFQPRINYKNLTICFNRLESEIEAAVVYNFAAKVLHGEYAKFNSIPESQIPTQSRQDELEKKTLEKLKNKGLLNE